MYQPRARQFKRQDIAIYRKYIISRTPEYKSKGRLMCYLNIREINGPVIKKRVAFKPNKVNYTTALARTIYFIDSLQTN